MHLHPVLASEVARDLVVQRTEAAMTASRNRRLLEERHVEQEAAKRSLRPRLVARLAAGLRSVA